MPNPRKVLHFVTWLNQGGVETWLIRYLKVANSSGHWHADVLCRGKNKGELAGQASHFGAEVYHFPISYPTRRNAKHLATFLSKHRYDILHCHLNALNSVVIDAARLVGIPVVAMYHNEKLYPQRSGLLANLARPIVRHYTDRLIMHSVRNADLVAPVSQAVLTELERINGSRIENGSVLYLGTPDTDSISIEKRTLLRANVFQAGSEDKVILHVGSFTNQKNHFGIVSSFEILYNIYPRARLVLVGRGPLLADVKARIASSSAKNAIQVLGSRSDVEQLMQAADVFFLPSFHEGLPIVVMEAFAAGLPVVASLIPSLIEAMGGETSSLATTSDHAAFADRLLNVISDASYANRLRDIGYMMHSSNFSLAASTQSLHSAYSDMLRHSNSDHSDVPTELQSVRTH